MKCYFLRMDSSIFLTPSCRPPRTSTPSHSVSRSRDKGKKRVFVNPVCDTCSTCGKEYRCHRSFLKHIRAHRIFDQASRYPNVDKIMQHLSSNFMKIMEKIILKPAFSSKGEQYKGMLQLMIDSHSSYCDLDEWNQFEHLIQSSLTNGLQDSKFLLPSALTALLQKNAEHFLCNTSQRLQLSSLFDVCIPDCSKDLIQFFVADLVLVLISEILMFVSASVRESVEIPLLTATTSAVLDNNHLESIYYVAGAKVRAFYNKSLRFPKHKLWKNIGSVISEKLLESDTVPGPPANVKGWTKAQSRGRLFFVSAALFDFFCGVAEVLEKEKTRKRVDFQKVIENVCDCGVLILWDEAVGDSLTQDESYKFMCAMIVAFCQTYSVGEANRMMNSLRRKGEASLPLRHRVAPK